MIYLIGSLKNPVIPQLAIKLRDSGFEVFDDWYSAGPHADDHWQDHCRQRKMTYQDALASPHAEDVFAFDLKWIERATSVVLVLPAGKSGHLEFGYAIGQGKPGFILLAGDPDRYDVMYKFATGVVANDQQLVSKLRYVE
jgi:nucleoside 2-deoxyribosyltransferase